MAAEIPIQNVYYLLCYAWGQMREGEIVETGATGQTELANLFAQVLINGTRRVLRQDLDRGYVTRSEDTSRLRGRIDFSTSVKRALLPRAKAHCRYDTLSRDVLHNRILKGTLSHLARTAEIDSDLRSQLLHLRRRFRDVGDVPLRRSLFRRVQLHGNNAFYRFLMNVCRLVAENVIVEEGGERRQFRDFRRDDAIMSNVFERFVRRFFAHEQDLYQVEAPQILWDLDGERPARLPAMYTDVVLRSEDRTIIIDTKYYANTLQSHHSKQSYHSKNLYQLFAYLINAEAKGPDYEGADGMLLYPTVSTQLDEAFDVRGHRIRVCSIDLGQAWTGVRDDLLALVGCH
jgi:5-methylcytosine-specific restriction enzyme subunit McrC